MKQLFTELGESLFGNLKAEEQLVLNFHGEDTLFVRFNKSKVRQPTTVLQIELSLTLKNDGREASISMPLTNNFDLDIKQGLENLGILRQRVATIEHQPFFVEASNNGQSSSINEGTSLDSGLVIDIITGETTDVDLAGILTSGTIYLGNSNSMGQQHWFESTSFCFDYSLYTEKEKAVKAAYSGTVFIADEFIANLNEAKASLIHLEKPNRRLPPGKYNCYLAPAAVSEILGTFNWGGPSQSSLKRGNSPLQQMVDDDRKLSPLFSLGEDFSLGLTPVFNSEGEVAESVLPIFSQGKLVNLLTSSKTAKEYNLPSNAANDSESMRSPVINTGKLAREDILKELNNGIYIANLHYLNWSDSKKGRITGMTRFACFLVENGNIVAPIKDLRFDETIYNIWGDNLLAVTDFADTEVDTGTYSRRSTGGSRCPGLLVKEFNFTL